MNGQKCEPKVVVVMVPLPAQGHLNQLLHLSHLITSYDIPVHYACSATHNRQAKLRSHGWHDHDHDHDHILTTSTKIQFHDFQLPPYDPSPPPSDLHLSTPFPTQFLPLFEASMLHLREPTHHLLQELSIKFDRVIVIHDILMAYVVQDVKFIPNAQAFTFIPISAFTMFLDSWNPIPRKFKPFQLHPTDIPQSNNNDKNNNNSLDYRGSMTLEMLDFTRKQVKLLGFESGWLYNTSRVIEGRYVNLLEKLQINKKHFAIGPFHPMEHGSGLKTQHRGGCLKWLDKQEKGSVIYVSFGSSISLTDDQIQELANGLHKCGQKFIWVLRKADSRDAFVQENGDMQEPQLPKGYEEKVKNKGIVIRDWAPQVEILAHTSVGGFMSHCGWNSCIESLSMGVPIAAWPMHTDQPRNAILVSQVLRVGVLVRDWAYRSELVMSNTIVNVVKMLMVSKEGKEIKERAVKLGEAIRGSTVKGGASCLEREAFIAYITRDVSLDDQIKLTSTQSNGSIHIRSGL